jgi:Skp family chaperone for outer membrane proteins
MSLQASLSSRRQQHTRDVEKERHEMEASRRELDSTSRSQMEREKRASKVWSVWLVWLV